MRLLIAVLMLLTLGGDVFAGPILDRIRDRVQQRRGYVVPSPAPVQAAAAPARFCDCGNGCTCTQPSANSPGPFFYVCPHRLGETCPVSGQPACAGGKCGPRATLVAPATLQSCPNGRCPKQR